MLVLNKLQTGLDQIRLHYISSSHTRLIRCSTLDGYLMQASTDKFGNTNQVLLPPECLQCIVCGPSNR